MDNEALEIKIKAQAETTTQQLKMLENQLKSVGGTIKTVKTQVDTVKGTTKYIVSATQGVKNLKLQIDELGNIKSFSSVTRQAKSLGAALRSSIDFNRLYLYWNLTKRLRDTLKSCFTNAVDYQETVNKFNVAMGSSVAQATKFQNVLNEALGTARKDMMDYQATFKNILSGLGNLSTKTTEKLSESLLQMGLDYSSLYNTEQASAMNKFQAALTGSIRPIRSESGYDVSDLTIAAKAQQLGVDKTSKELTQMEKRMLRIIVLMEQMARTGAMQDLARTIESPSNQIKVLKNQVQELGIWLGNVFMGTLGSILPYVNGFIMVLKELAKMLAIFVGFKETSTGLGDAFEVAEDATDNISSGVGSAAAKAKELRKTLMGFDVLNVIQTPTKSTGGSGGGSADLGTIDPKILGALEEYDSLMSKVKMKATDIRDKIMDWLGFTKVINPLTGEISWKLREGNTWIEKIKNILKIIAGLFLFTKAVKLLGALKNIVTVISGGEATTHTFAAGLGVLGKAFKGTKKWIVDGITQFKYFKAIGATTGEAVQETASKMFDAIPKAVKLGVGVTGLAVSYYNAYDAMRDFSEGEKPASTAFTQLGISIGGAAASGALLGSVIPGIGTGIGALVGAATAAIPALLGYKTEEEKTTEAVLEGIEARRKYRDSITATRDVIEDTVNSQLSQVEYTQKLVSELDTLVAANGRVKKGYEDRVAFILNQLNSAYGTNYQLINGEIQNYSDLKESIYKVIDAKKAEILLTANEEAYAEALKNRSKLYNDLEAATKEANSAEEEYKEFLSQYNLTIDDITNSTGKAVMAISGMSYKSTKNLKALGQRFNETKKDAEEAATAYEENNKTIIYWEDLKTATITGNQEEIDKAVKKITSSYQTETGKQKVTLSQQLKEEKAFYEQRLSELEKSGVEITDEMRENDATAYNIVVDSLKEQSSAVEELTPEVKEAWKTLASQSREEYTEALRGLPEDVQKQVQLTTGVIVNELDIARPNVYNSALKVRNSIMQPLSENQVVTPTITYKPTVSINTSGAISAFSTFDRAVADGLKTRQTTKLTLMNRQKFHAFASGGFPDIGELFMAREAGPELVGKIGNRNAVVNNQQIVEAVSTGVANAVSRTLGNQGNSFEFIIDGEKMTDVVVRRLNRRANITGMAMGV